VPSNLPWPRWTLVAVSSHVTEVDPRDADVRELVWHHLRFTNGASPAEFAFALDEDGLAEAGVTVFGVREDGALLAIGALKRLDDTHAELKSMHTADSARRRGLGRLILDHVLATARARGYTRISLETGSTEEFAGARVLYASAGFVPCAPFGDYRPSGWNTYMTLDLT